MLLLRVFTPYVLFNFILVFSFSVTINSYVQIQNINLIFYIIPFVDFNSIDYVQIVTSK